MSQRRERVLFVAVLLAWAGYLGAMAGLTPTTLDDWYAVAWYRTHTLSVSNVLEYAGYNYFHYNPRPGETLLLLLNGPRAIHIVLAPLIQILLLFVVSALALGRWPRADRRGLLELGAAQALIWLCIPIPGTIYLYRPFAANYLFSSCFQLLVFVPFRLELAAAPGPRRRWLAPLLLVAGVLGGMTNEHTGPSAIVVALGLCLWAAHRRRLRAWMIAAAVGLVVGYALLYLAPGHTVRYSGLATEISPLAVLRRRGLMDSLRVLGAVVTEVQAGVALTVGLWLLARRSRRLVLVPETLAVIAVCVVGAGMITVTTFASPIVEDRVMLAACLLLAVALLAALGVAGGEAAARRVLAYSSAAVVGLAAVTLLSVYLGLAGEAAARSSAFAAARPGSVVSVEPSARRRRDRWSYGEDLEFAYMREFVAHHVYDLEGIELVPQRPGAQPTPPERMEVTVTYDPPVDARQARPDWPLWRHVPVQWAWTVREIRESLAYLRQVPGHRLVAIDVTVDPATAGLVPGRPIYLVRWRDGAYARVDARSRIDRDGYPYLSLADPRLPLAPTAAWLVACGGTRRLKLRRRADGLSVDAEVECPGNHTVYVCDDAACWLAGRYW